MSLVKFSAIACLSITTQLCCFTNATAAENVAREFKAIPKNSKIAIIPADIELFSLSAGGIEEPRADWTQAANQHFQKAIIGKNLQLGFTPIVIKDDLVDEFAEVNSLHGAVAQAINLHHLGLNEYNLPTKEKQLNWSLGEAVKPIQEKTNADYAIFTWVRDSYASPERKAAIVAMALLGVSIRGGIQAGYASLVDLKTGQILWFNRMVNASGDLREEDVAQKSVENLLDKFPVEK